MKASVFAFVIVLGLAACSSQSEPVAEEQATPLPPPVELIEALTEAPVVTDRFATSQLEIKDQVMERAPRLYNFQDIPNGWINQDQLAQLMQLIHSEDECYVPTDPNCGSNHTVATASKGFLARQLLTAYIQGLDYGFDANPAVPPMSTEQLEAWWLQQLETTS